jgi:hypothetical protein
LDIYFVVETVAKGPPIGSSHKFWRRVEQKKTGKRDFSTDLEAGAVVEVCAADGLANNVPTPAAADVRDLRAPDDAQGRNDPSRRKHIGLAKGKG